MSVKRLNNGELVTWGPLTGGGGGGGVADSDLWDIALKNVDLTDGTWLLHDPDSLIDSVAYANNQNEITVNALASGNNPKYNWKNSGEKKAPRWYKVAKIGDNEINREHMVTGIYKLKFDASRDLSADVVVGLSKIPTSDVTTGVNLGGAYGLIQAQANSNASYGVYTFSGSTSLSTGGPTQGLISFQHGGDKIGGGVATLLDSNGESNNSGIDRSSNQDHSDNGRPMSTMVGIGLRNNNTAWDAGDKVRISIKYLHIKGSLS